MYSARQTEEKHYWAHGDARTHGKASGQPPILLTAEGSAHWKMFSLNLFEEELGTGGFGWCVCLFCSLLHIIL